VSTSPRYGKRRGQRSDPHGTFKQHPSDGTSREVVGARDKAGQIAETLVRLDHLIRSITDGGVTFVCQFGVLSAPKSCLPLNFVEMIGADAQRNGKAVFLVDDAEQTH
jgi:hypothetical protein